MNSANSRLFYTKPAEYRESALLLGNGRLGAMVFGGISHEEIDLNEGRNYGKASGINASLDKTHNCHSI